MKTREMYEKTINYFENGTEEDGAVVLELLEAYKEALAKMDAQNEARRVKSAEKSALKQAEKAPIREALYAVMRGADEPMTASMLIEAAGLEDVKAASVPSLMKPLVESGMVAKVDVKISGHGTQRGYVRT